MLLDAEVTVIHSMPKVIFKAVRADITSIPALAIPLAEFSLMLPSFLLVTSLVMASHL
jgi:hypothetical protein